MSTHTFFFLPSILQINLNSFVIGPSSAQNALIDLIQRQHQLTHIILEFGPRDSFLGQTVWGILECVSLSGGGVSAPGPSAPQLSSGRASSSFSLSPLLLLSKGV